MTESIKNFLESREWLHNKGRFYETPMGDLIKAFELLGVDEKHLK